jgi:hypothetical protein
MLEFLRKIINFKSVDVVGIYRDSDKTVYYLLTLKNQKNKVSVITIDKFENPNALKQSVTHPIILLVDGKGILNKKIDVTNENDINWHKNIDYTAIHHLTHINDNIRIISFCKKGIVDEAIADFQKQGFKILDFYLGPLPSIMLQQTINEIEVHSNGSVLTFSGNLLSDISRDIEDRPVNYQVGGTAVSKYHLPLYGAGIHYFAPRKNIARSHSAFLNKDEVIYKKAFDIFGMAMVAGFFILLLISYFSIQYFSSKNMELNQKSVFAKQSYQQIVQMEAERDEKLKILNETGLLSGKFITSYPYQLIAAIPENIRLAKLDVFPVGESKPNKKMALDSKEIFIAGAVKEELVFNNWLNQLKRIPWIQHFEIISFRKDKNELSQFEIKITVK